MVIYMLGVPSVEPADGETAKEMLLRSRHKVYVTPFETYEEEIREQLQGLLGEHGFNHETDIRAITVNRWPHGYSYEYMSLDDPASKWLGETEWYEKLPNADDILVRHLLSHSSGISDYPGRVSFTQSGHV